ncbi:hypothetical protein ILYODFUR_016730 [Ilyodon furcidens]|uniref:Uncharacterized protein n=1 Tax=Ilyodon furcidens TaxID=33524 RepID=A0ABV0U7A3_9TELE
MGSQFSSASSGVWNLQLQSKWLFGCVAHLIYEAMKYCPVFLFHSIVLCPHEKQWPHPRRPGKFGLEPPLYGRSKAEDDLLGAKRRELWRADRQRVEAMKGSLKAAVGV